MEFEIRKMKPEEIVLAIDWARKEGWNPGLHDDFCFYEADPNGFFVGLLNNEPIVVGSAVAYDDHYGFCGLYIVKPEYRSHGYGLQLTEARLKHLGDRTVGLDGVLEKVSKYERLGYVAAYKQIRYELLTLPKNITSEIVNLQTIPFDQLAAFDRRYFPAPRDAFLKAWISQSDCYALGYMKDTLQGYGVIRKCSLGYKIGPLFAENEEIARALFEALCSKIKEGPVYLDVPESNPKALKLVADYKMLPIFEVIRMYRNGTPHYDINGIFGITTYELG